MNNWDGKVRIILGGWIVGSVLLLLSGLVYLTYNLALLLLPPMYAETLTLASGGMYILSVFRWFLVSHRFRILENYDRK